MTIKPGILAYLSSDCVNEGVIVEVLKIGPVVEGSQSWHCKSKTPLMCDVYRNGRNMGGVHLRTDICVQERYLRPINGLPITDDIKDEVTA